jgi:hypothetical protein
MARRDASLRRAASGLFLRCVVMRRVYIRRDGPS